MNSITRSRQRRYVLMLLPGIITVVILIVIPLVAVVITSTFNYSFVYKTQNRFIGLGNYLSLVQDADFWNSLKVAFYYGIGSVTLQVFFGFLIALLVSTQFRAMKRTRILFLLPMTMPPIVASIIWKLFFTPNVPGMNFILEILRLPKPNWFDHAFSALSAVIITNVWQWTPFCMLLILASLESMPTDPFESAITDGANAWQRFVYITLPLLRPTLAFVYTFRLIESLKIFPLVYVMTGGGPGNSTEPINFYAYQEGFRYNQLGYGSAIVVVMLLIIMFVVWLMRRGQESERG